MPQSVVAVASSAIRHARDAPRSRKLRKHRAIAAVSLVIAVLLGALGIGGGPSQRQGLHRAAVPFGLKAQVRKAAASQWYPCAVTGGTCRCTGTVVLSNLLGVALREVNADGEVQCTADAFGGSSHIDPRVCWCQSGVAWGDDVRSGLASMVRQGMTPRIEIAVDSETGKTGCSPEGDGGWYGCVVMDTRQDTTVIPQVMLRTVSPEELLDMTLRKLDSCHRLAPGSSLRILGVSSGQFSDEVAMSVSSARMCSTVYHPGTGALWTAKSSSLYCSTQPGTCTLTPCECKRVSDKKLEVRTPQGQRCWVCAKPGQEYAFRVNTMAEHMTGGALSWWPPSGINCPPILWAFMDWRAVIKDCPAISLYFGLFVFCLFLRKAEEISGGRLQWTRVAPLFGPTLKRGELWRFISFTFFHVQFGELFQNILTMLDTLDIESTPAIILGDGSNLKCGVGAKQNYMCYPSIGIGTYHTLGVALVSAAMGGMCSTWINFQAIVTGASALGFGFSGAVVALYGLYAGAELDQATSVQRSFQDWVVLRLIFVGFHIAMEWVRSISQRDATGFFAHTAAFVTGFAYVLYFLPPMGDGTMFPSGHPYIVPCTFDMRAGHYMDSSVPECVRIFSNTYEFEVSKLRLMIGIGFVSCVALTVFNVFVFQKRVSSSEAMLLAGYEVSAVCGFPRGGGEEQVSRVEGRDIVLWCEIVSVGNLRASREVVKPVVEVRIVTQSDPQKQPMRGLNRQPEASQRTRALDQAEVTWEWKEAVFLPVKYSKSSYVQIVLWNMARSDPEVLASVSLPMPQALRVNRQNVNEMRIKLRPLGARGHDALVVGCFSSTRVHVRFRCLELDEFRRLRARVKAELEEGKPKLQFYQQQLAALRQSQNEGNSQAAS
eukprot:TRINITY_DN23691_c0_g1_i1.p1 TRINITY_DN23691_c0_g1~~TRINITY_DN23691_c0_g1_i1.p1  ORF type:complete len:885 (-),score=85.35 TRINITY_DN23691_c0_g1_i1:8-2662(-)